MLKVRGGCYNYRFKLYKWLNVAAKTVVANLSWLSEYLMCSDEYFMFVDDQTNGVSFHSVVVLSWFFSVELKLHLVILWVANFFCFFSLLKVIQNEFMRSSFLPECQPKVLRISALPSNKLQGLKSLKFLVGILGETMTS